MYSKLLQQEPGIFIVVLLISIIITLAAYSAFPLIFAAVRNKPITKKKYRCLCYGINVAVMLLFMVFNGGSINIGPYFLWTWAFSSCGIKILDSNGSLEDGASFTPTTKAALPQDAICFCRKCGKKLIGNSNFCSKCGTKIMVVREVDKGSHPAANKEPSTIWICGNCKTKNLSTRNDCWACKAPK